MGGPGVLLICSCPPGEPLPAHQDPGGLLLLRVGAAGGARGPRSLLCGDGRGHDRGHLVSGAELGAEPIPSATTIWGGCIQPWCWCVPNVIIMWGAVPISWAGMSQVLTTTLRSCVSYCCVPGATATWGACSFGKSQVPPQLGGQVPFLVLRNSSTHQSGSQCLGVPSGAWGVTWCLRVSWGA